jgi:hypothetical protein
MLYSVLIYGSEADVAALSKEEDEALVAQHIVVQKKLTEEGKLRPVVRLMPTAHAITLRKGNESFLMDGPFAETKEQLLGFYLLDCETREAAVEAARLIGTSCNSRAIEIRPVSWFHPGIVST